MSLNLSPFSVFKQPKKHPTSNWPLFSHWLDDTFDIDTAPRQYAFYTIWGISMYNFASLRWKARKVQKLVPDSVVSANNRFELLRYYRQRSSVWIIVPFFFSMSICGMGAFRRAEEVDRDGSRFREYYRRAKYSGFDEETSILLAKDVVMKSDTKQQGNKLLELAITNLKLHEQQREADKENNIIHASNIPNMDIIVPTDAQAQV